MQQRPQRIAVLPGDGIGPEVMAQALKVLQVLRTAGLAVEFTLLPVGGQAIAQGLPALPAHCLSAMRAADAILLGPVGGPAFDHLERSQRPESALLHIRQQLGLYSALRHIHVSAGSEVFSPLRPAVLRGVDMLVVRELTAGVYSSQPKGQQRMATPDGRWMDEAYDTTRYNEATVRRIAHCAFEQALARRKKVSSIDKANVMASSGLWRAVVTDTARHYPQVQLEHVYADTAATLLFTQPAEFDVVLADNLFGDLLGDMGSGLVGSVGLPANALLGPDGVAVFEPGHGSAPDLAGRGIANPIACIRALALLLRLGLQQVFFADVVEEAIATVLRSQQGVTADLAALAGSAPLVSTDRMGDLIAQAVQQRVSACE